MMRTWVISLSLLSFLPHLILSGRPTDNYFGHHICSRPNGGNTIQMMSSDFETNRDILLSNFTSDDEINYGYYTSSVGEGSDTIYAQGLCRADVDPDTCRSCFNDAKTTLPKKCKTQKDAFRFQDLCSFHYSDNSLQGKYLYPSFSYGYNNPIDAKDARSHIDALNDLMQDLKSQASGGGDDYKVAAGSQTSSQSETVYGLVQCMPDLTQQDCEDCLRDAISQIPRCCQNKVGGRVIKYSCNVRFEMVKFYNDI